MFETYKEIVKRYRVMRHEEMDIARKATYRLNGIDPDDLWSLLWSFDNKDDAEACLQDYESNPNKPSFYTYKMVDAGVPHTEIERNAWL